MHLQFINTLQANILLATGQVANATITKIETGSVKVSNTIAFTGNDTTAATAARDTVFSALSSTSSSDLTKIFGTSFGAVTVSSPQSTVSNNPSKRCLVAHRHCDCLITSLLDLQRSLLCMSMDQPKLDKLCGVAASSGVAAVGLSMVGVFGSLAALLFSSLVV